MINLEKQRDQRTNISAVTEPLSLVYSSGEIENCHSSFCAEEVRPRTAYGRNLGLDLKAQKNFKGHKGPVDVVVDKTITFSR